MSSYSIMHTQASSSSLYGALTPMAKGDRHVVPGRMEEVTAREQRSQHNTQRDDLPSRSNNDVSGMRGSMVVDLPRAGHSTSLGSSGSRRQSQPIAGDYSYSLPSHTPSEATSVLEEAQGNSLCDRMDDFHFSPQLSERQGRVEQGRTHVSRNATSSAKVTASFDVSSSRTAHREYPVGEASSFGSPSAGEYPAAVYPAFIPGHEHVGPSDQAWRGDASTQELVHSTSTISGFTCSPYGFDGCRVYSGEESSSSYDPSSFADGFMQNSAPMGMTGQPATSPLQHPQALPRSVHGGDRGRVGRSL
ncbi:hypothetical protein EV401DRAFT_1032621 [Pisolithus croceorrhizus]|nr:hypothetical protein EV401DRAFT_1032621 [Pisolithus croceorrhizus]